MTKFKTLETILVGSYTKAVARVNESFLLVNDVLNINKSRHCFTIARTIKSILKKRDAKRVYKLPLIPDQCILFN